MADELSEFRFGVATADHQCEAYDGQDDVRDVWERVRGLTPRGKATDFWNRYKEDVDLAKGLGCRAFRLSLAWARLEPEPGVWDDAAFIHYRAVLQYMRDAGMWTVVTLHHNTWPLHVQAAGNGAGMLDPHFPSRLAAYADQVGRRLGDLIDYYVTLNEPNQLVYGFIKGFWMRSYPVPPGLEPYATGEQQMDAVLKLIPNLFRAHTQARAALQAVHPGAKCGVNPLVLGLPRWIQRWVDRAATHVKSPEQVRRQAGRMTQHQIIEPTRVDVSIAQLTMTQQRMSELLFSEPYAIAHPSMLHASSLVPPANLQSCKLRIGVIESSPAAARAAGIFVAAGINYYPHAEAAVQALRAGQIDIVFDGDLILKQFANGGFALTVLQGTSAPFAVAVALGKRTLLNAVDFALREYKASHPELPTGHNRRNVAHVGKAGSKQLSREVPDLDRSLEFIRKRGVLRVGIHPGVEGLCMPDGAGGYTGLEPDLGRAIAKVIFGTDEGHVRFVLLTGFARASAASSPFKIFDAIRKTFGMFGTLVGTNWWDLGMAGRLPHFLCPPECVGKLDYVGIDYYWGIPTLWPRQLQRLSAAAECHYALAPVWPNVLDDLLREAQEMFPDKPIIVIENGCVTSADGYSRAKYLEAHIKRVERALRRGVPIVAYLCWSITSNREWGLPFDDNSDFGLYHIDLDHDPELKRVPTEASTRYAQLIAASKST
jgi:beta-glucosidase/6-phospho-beta-glucosidase/beta-galactosidase/ABC-type amino acid transport substrate-binding protein